MAVATHARSAGAADIVQRFGSAQQGRDFCVRVAAFPTQRATASMCAEDLMREEGKDADTRDRATRRPVEWSLHVQM